MYLHVGNNKSIRKQDIIGIFDLDNATLSEITRRFLAEEEKKGNVFSAKEEIPKSFVLFYDRKAEKNKICFSQISGTALIGRSMKR